MREKEEFKNELPCLRKFTILTPKECDGTMTIDRRFTRGNILAYTCNKCDATFRWEVRERRWILRIYKEYPIKTNITPIAKDRPSPKNIF